MEEQTEPAILGDLGDLAADHAFRLRVLRLLYGRRRQRPESPGLSLLEFETSAPSPREQLMFTLWYLRDRGYASQDEHSNFVITGNGVDYLEQAGGVGGK